MKDQQLIKHSEECHGADLGSLLRRTLASGDDLNNEDDEALEELKQELAKPLEKRPNEETAANDVNALLAKVKAIAKKTNSGAEPFFPNFRWAPYHIAELITDISALAPEAISRMIVDSVVLNEYETATSDIQNAQRLRLQCERNYKFGLLTLNHRKVILLGVH